MAIFGHQEFNQYWAGFKESTSVWSGSLLFMFVVTIAVIMVSMGMVVSVIV